jgi:hypothetical protein
MERRRDGPQLVQPDPQQAQRVRIEDLREPHVPMTGSTTSGY